MPANCRSMRTPSLTELFDEISVEALARWAKRSSLRQAGVARNFPPEYLHPDEDARIAIVRGVYYRRSAVEGFAGDRTAEFSLRAEPENMHDPFAVAVDIDGTHAGYIPKEIALGLQALVVNGRARVAAHWSDYSNETPVIYLLVAWVC